MSYPYLLAAGLLIEGQVAAALPATSPVQPDDPPLLAESTKMQASQVAAPQIGGLEAERSTIEFSSQAKRPVRELEWRPPGEGLPLQLLNEAKDVDLFSQEETTFSPIREGQSERTDRSIPSQTSRTPSLRKRGVQPDWSDRETESSFAESSPIAMLSVGPVPDRSAPTQDIEQRIAVDRVPEQAVASEIPGRLLFQEQEANAELFDNAEHAPRVEVRHIRPESAPVNIAFSKPAAKRAPASGSQLYHQRLAALKAGKLYTRLSPDSFWSAWIGAARQPTYGEWKRLLALEAGAVARGQGANRLTVLLGDSLSLWFPSERLPDGQLWLNQGVSGDTSGGVMKRLSAFAQTRPTTIYVMVGINDLRRGKSDAEILNNVRQMIRQLRQNHPRSRLIIQSILPTRNNWVSNRRIQNLNHQIAAIARQENTNFLNLYNRFIDAQGQMRQELTTDGLHLSPQGYRVWQSALFQPEDRILPTPEPQPEWARSTQPKLARQPEQRLERRQIAAYQKWLRKSQEAISPFPEENATTQQDRRYERWLSRSEQKVVLSN